MGLHSACVQDKHDTSDHPVPGGELSVTEARAFFESGPAQCLTRAGVDNPRPFILGDAQLDWTEAAASASERLSSVDIPVHAEYIYRVTRQNNAGEYYTVDASSKVIVVKSPETDSLACYIRVCIPDKEYADLYDGDICSMTLNSEDRGDYCGLEFYATLEGVPIAVARYAQGKLTASAYLYDTSLTEDQRVRQFCALFRNMWIKRLPIGTRASSANDNFTAEPGTVFLDQFGNVYIVMGDKSVQLLSDYLNIQIIVDTGGGSGSSGGSGPGGSTGGSGGSEGGTGPGSGSGSGGGGNGPGSGSGSGGGTVIVGEPPSYKPRPPRIPIDPIPFLPISPEIFPPLQPEPPKEKLPCVDSLAQEANPLTEMKISDDNKSWRSNTWGNVRVDKYDNPHFHDGLDLSGIEGKTEIYSLYGGKVARVVYEQPNRIAKNTYPADYNGDKNGAGNRITIETVLPDGSKVQVSYWHLDVVENNPYTQQFKLGMDVKQGQKIGIVGRTGNAYKMKPHLHLKTYKMGSDKESDPANNPFGYLYTKFSPESGEVIRDC